MASQLLTMMQKRTFLKALFVACLAACLAVAIRFADKYFPFVKENVPDVLVFNVFVVFCSLVASFRSSHALIRYVNAASLAHKISVHCFQAGSTLVAFTRNATVDPAAVQNFIETLLRLLTVFSAQCYDGLGDGYVFNVVGYEDLNESFKTAYMDSGCKVEHLYQELNNLVVDAASSKVLVAPPPLLARGYQQMEFALTAYHDAKKLAVVPIPYSYAFITHIILCCEAVFVPFMLSNPDYTTGYPSCALFTFGGTFMLWFINGAANLLDNPFRREVGTLNMGEIHEELLTQLRDLCQYSRVRSPSLMKQPAEGSVGARALKAFHTHNLETQAKEKGFHWGGEKKPSKEDKDGFAMVAPLPGRGKGPATRNVAGLLPVRTKSEPHLPQMEQEPAPEAGNRIKVEEVVSNDMTACACCTFP